MEDFEPSMATQILKVLQGVWNRGQRGYTRAGLLIDVFNVPVSAIRNKRWDEWETRHRTLQGQVVRALWKLEQENKITVKKSKTPFGYFYKQTVVKS